MASSSTTALLKKKVRKTKPLSKRKKTASRMEKSNEIDEKWVKEENRTFSIYPGLPKPGNGSVLGEEETWLELAQFVKDDLQWLLSLEHHKFWSHMIHSPNAHKLLVSFLNKTPPNCLRSDFLVCEDVKNIFTEIEHLVFLVFLRLCTEKEKEGKISNLGKILYDNYLFTVPIILDICSIYGVSNRVLVMRLIDKVVTLAPDFLEDFHEIRPHFLQLLNIVEKKFPTEQVPRLKIQSGLQSKEIRDLVLHLHDTVSTLQIFLELCPKGRQIFCGCEFVSKVVAFYSNVLPEIENTWKDRRQSESSFVLDLIENCRIDFLKIIKSIFDSLSDNPIKKEESVDEYLTLMMELLSEPMFLTDYNILYSIEFEVESLIRGCSNVDTIKLNHILEGVTLAANTETGNKRKNQSMEDREGAEVRMNSLITEVKDILPHLEDRFIAKCLKHYDNNTERVIAAILENSLPPFLNSGEEGERSTENKGKPRDFEDFTEMLDDRRELREVKDRYAEFGFIADDIYDDEYDDTCDENIDVAVREADEMEKQRRPFVTPRILRPREEGDDNEEEEEEEEEEMEQRRDCFVPNPAEIRERRERLREERSKRDVIGGAKGQGQSKQVMRNRDYKGAHKSSMGNHNRKKQASRKMHQGMIPS